MKKVILILIVSFAFLSAKTQVKDTVFTGQTVVASLGDTISVVDVITRNTVVTSQSGVSVVDEVFYVPATAPNDTIYTLMAARTSGKKAAILFERGSERDTTITVSGDSLVFGAYGTGARPKLYGSKLITGWTLHSGNIWKAEVGDTVTQVFLDGERIQLARHSEGNFDTITGVTSQTIFTVSALNGSVTDNYYTDISVILRSASWRAEVRTVSASTGNTLTISSAPSSTMAINQGVMISNHLDFLTKAGEWYYDSATDTLYVWTPNGDSPANYEVRGSVHEAGVYMTAKSNVTVRDLEILQQKRSGVEVAGGVSENITVLNNKIHGQGRYGTYTMLETNLGRNHLFSHNTIFNTGVYGIYSYHAGDSQYSFNTISDIGTYSSWGLNTVFGDGINVSSETVTNSVNEIKYNDIENVAWSGIYWRGVTNITHNYIKKAVMRKGDGGAIYAGSTSVGGSYIAYNIIDGFYGNREGYLSGNPDGYGLYLDENTDSVTAEYNTIINGADYNADFGLFCHKPNNHNLRFNTLYNNGGNFLTQNTPAGTTTFKNNLSIIGHEKEYPRFSSQVHTYINTSGIEHDSNHYVNVHPTKNVFVGVDDVSRNFTDWKTYTGQDSLSTVNETPLATNETQRVLINPKSTNVTFYLHNSVPKDENGDSISSNIVLAPYRSQYVKGVDVENIMDYQMSTITINLFQVASLNVSKTVDVIVSSYSPNTVTHWLIKENDTIPTVDDVNWSATRPTSYTFSTEGEKSLYAFVKDGSGNISDVASATTTIYDLETPLVHSYDFSETSGTTSNDLVGTLDGTISGSPTMDAEKYTLDGTDDKVVYGIPAVLNSTSYINDFSIHMRVTISALPGVGVSHHLFNQTVNFLVGVVIRYNEYGDLLAVIRRADESGIGKNHAAILTVGNTYDITLVWDATALTANLYVNQSAATSNYTVIGSNGNSSGIWLGARYTSGGGDSFSKSELHEFNIFDKALSATEIKTWINR